MTQAPTASVVICTYDRPDLFEAALRSCLSEATRRAVRFEIVVADNSIAGHAAAIVARLPPGAPVRLVAVSPPNISLARNAGLRACLAPLIAFMDDDLVLEPGWLDALIEVVRCTGADAAVGPVRPRFAAGAAPGWDPQGARFTRVLDLPSGTPIAASGRHRPAGFALSTASSIWRAATCFADPAPFDPAFGACGGEDLDLFLRLERRGRRFVWCAEAGVLETIQPRRAELSYQILRAYSGAQVYAAAMVNNAVRPRATALDIAWRGALQAGAYAIAAAVLRLARAVGRRSPRLEQLAVRAALAAAAGRGKLRWRDRVALYHVERSTGVERSPGIGRSSGSASPVVTAR